MGLLFCILPPAAATLSYFPLWQSDSPEKTIAGGTALLLILSVYPLYKWIRRRFSSVSAYIMWLILFLLFFALSKIADEMTVICFVGFISNLIGAIILRFAKRGAKE